MRRIPAGKKTSVVFTWSSSNWDWRWKTGRTSRSKLSGLVKKWRKMCHQKPWAESMTYLMQLPGFGVITAMTVLAAIGEIQRFESPKHLASYSGLTPGLEQSGTKNRGKGITKEGRRELRWAIGGSSSTGSEVRSRLENPFPGNAKAHAP